MDRQLQIAPVSAPPAGEKRIALVIGNSAYKTSPLKNPVNDARSMSKALAATGFKVHVIEDATQAAMVRAIRNFGNEIQNGGVGLFYYAGHGMQVRGKNYLIPVNADIEHEDEIEFNAVDANLILSKMDTAKSSLNLMILDACRNNPFARAFRSGTQGLAQMEAPSGTLVAFATAPGAVAADGDGSNGLYTKHLLANLAKPGLPIEQVFKEVRIGVTKETNNRQVPWESSSLTGNFFFVPGSGAAMSEAERKREVDRAVAEAVRGEQAKMERFVQEMLAKQRAQLEEDMLRMGVKPPAPKPAAVAASPAPSPASAPAATAPAPAAQVASIAPTAVASAAGLDPRYPRAGDRWEYRYTDTHTRKTRNMAFSVAGATRDGIVQTGGFVGAKDFQVAYSAGPQLVRNDYWEFSPYLLAFGDGGADATWRNIFPQNTPFCGPPASCYFQGRVDGREKVTTPAGTFDAVKVTVELNGRSLPGTHNSSSTYRRMTYWYADAAKRMVKSSVRTMSGQSTEDDYEIELTSYKLGDGTSDPAPAPAPSASSAAPIIQASAAPAAIAAATPPGEAQIRFAIRGLTSGNTSVSSIRDGDCRDGRVKIATVGAQIVFHNRKKIGLPLANDYEEGHFTETTIPGGSPYTFHMHWNGVAQVCEVTAGFLPQPGRMYEAVHYVERASCRVQVYEIAQTNGAHHRVPERSANRPSMQCRGS